MKYKSTILFPIIIFLSSITFGQTNKYAIGGGIGIGSLMGNFPSQTTLGGKLFFEILQPIVPFDKFQISYTFAQKIEKFLPGNTKIKYFSLMHSFAFSGIFLQPLNEQINVEEGIGLILLNDRSFDDINTWNFGVLISLGAGTNLTKSLEILINFEYGLTVTNTNSSYLLFLLNSKYYF